MTELDKKLQELALNNLAMFMALVGKDAIQTAKAKILRLEGKSYSQICIKLGMSMQQVRTACAQKEPVKN